MAETTPIPTVRPPGWFFLFGLFALSLTISLAAAENLTSHRRLLNDTHDRAVYARCGSWWRLSLRPYADLPCEYPQLAVYAFALPDVLLAPLGPPPASRGPTRYALVHSLLMMVVLWLMIRLLYALHPVRPGFAFLLLLPACWYFTFNRYDILPAYLSLAGILLLLRGRYEWAGVTLAIGVLTNWYLLVLLPIFMNYAWHQTRAHAQWRLLAAYAATCALVLWPTFLGGGLPALTAPIHLIHMIHTERTFYAAAALRRFSGIELTTEHLFLLCFGLQALVAVCSLLRPIRSDRALLEWSTAAILGFILFATFSSPQWILWAIPLLIWLARDRYDVLWIVALDLITYLQFPLLVDGPGRSSWIFSLVTAARNLLIAGLLLRLLLPLLARQHTPARSSVA